MLTQKEKKISQKLSDAWNIFFELPDQNDMDKIEFAHAIHQAQYLIAKRSTVREHPEIYSNKTIDKE